MQICSTLMLAILALSCGCGRGPRQPIDSETSIQLLGNIPNTVPLPKKLEIYSDLKDGARELSRRFSEKKGENSDLVFQTEDPGEIEAFITAMRNERASPIIDVSKRKGKSYPGKGGWTKRTEIKDDGNS